VNWSLHGDDGALVADVVSAHARLGGWDETWVYTATTPQVRGEEEVLTKVLPTLRPTPNPLVSRSEHEECVLPPTDISGTDSTPVRAPVDPTSNAVIATSNNTIVAIHNGCRLHRSEPRPDVCFTCETAPTTPTEATRTPANPDDWTQ